MLTYLTPNRYRLTPIEASILKVINYQFEASCNEIAAMALLMPSQVFLGLLSLETKCMIKNNKGIYTSTSVGTAIYYALHLDREIPPIGRIAPIRWTFLKLKNCHSVEVVNGN